MDHFIQEDTVKY